MAVVIEAALIRPPSYSDSVFKDECLFSFQTPESEGGLNVCLECYQGFAPFNVTDKTNYTFSHYSVTGHSLFLNIQKFFQKEVQEQQLQKKLKLDKVQILQENEDDYYVSEYKLVSVEKDFAVPLSVSQISGSYQVLNPDISDNIKATIVGVLEATSMKMKNDIQSWEQEIKPCKHSEKLQQSVSGSYVLPKACVTCGLQENLWICLHCGNIGCGREQFGGLKGNSHALKHNDYTQHPVAVKLGSLSLKQGKADCYCYECNDEVKVIDLADKLKVFGINTESFSEQNEKTLTELNIQQNLTWQFNMESDTGELLEPVFGKSLVGLKNLGNSCYINSTIQVLAHLKSFQDIFYGKDYFNFPLESLQKPYDDLYLQLIKIYNGVVSDKYSKPNMNSTDSIKWQKGLSLAIFKSLIGKANEEFKSQNQQDAFEFLLFFFDQMETYYYKHNSLDSSCFKENPVDRFKFVMNNKLVLDNKFKIHKELDNYLMLNLPEQVDRTDEDGIIQYKKVDINEAIHDHFTSNELLDLGGQDYVKYNRLASLPDLLLVQIQRAKLVNWVPTKTSVPVIVPDEKINLSQYVLSVNEAQAEASSSKLILEEEEEEETKETFEANQEVMNNLLQMGFPENRCKKALFNVGNSSNPEDAMNWLFAHMEDPDIDEPLVLPAGGMTKDFNEPSDEQVNNLVAMGFTEKLAKKALYVNGKNPEAAVEWLFNNPDDNGEIDKATDKPTGQPCAKDQIEQILASTRDIISEKDAEYYLKGVVCHKGNSIHTGHYVSFIRQKYEGKVQWVLYNDEKVVLANDKKNMDEIEKNGYLFLFVKHGSVDDEFSEA